jgi:hypothetical protein
MLAIRLKFYPINGGVPACRETLPRGERGVATGNGSEVAKQLFWGVPAESGGSQNPKGRAIEGREGRALSLSSSPLAAKA